jgi:exodeoxyribonuclease VII small subunit
MAARRETTRARTDPGEEPSFEEALGRLESIVAELEGGQLSLEQSLSRYEEGVRLSRQLTRALDAAEQRIERLVSQDGETLTEPLQLDLGEGGKGSGQEGPTS